MIKSYITVSLTLYYTLLPFNFISWTMAKKKKEREPFLLWRYEKHLADLSDSECRERLEAMFYYRNNGEILENISSWVKIILREQIEEREQNKEQFEKNNKAQSDRIKKYRDNVKKDTTVYHGIPQNTTATNYILSKDNINLNNISSNISSKKNKLLSPSELMEWYRNDKNLYDLVNQRGYTDEWAIEERVNYKQSWVKKTNWKKVSPYTSVSWFLRALKKTVKEVSPDKIRPDIWPRLRYAVDQAIMKWDGIYWNDTYEKEYLDMKETQNTDFII